MNYRIILYTFGWVLNIIAGALVLPLSCAIIYNEPYTQCFIFAMIICLFIGLPVTLKQPENKTMYAKEGFVTVTLCWLAMSFFGSLPFVFSGCIPNFVDALFETVSGFTTTGASILQNVEVLPKCMIFWRSFTHWMGGMGVLVFLVAILPLSGGNNLYLIKAESTGPSVSKLVPKVRSTAKILYIMYLSLTLLLAILMLFDSEIGLFEALTLSFGTAGTGGFGILSTSVESYSNYVQILITVFMILFGVDFSLFYLLVLGKIKDIFHSEELRCYLAVIAVSIILITVNCIGYFENIWITLRHAAFQVASIITTTGFSTLDYSVWPEFSKLILILLMFVGACAGSTGGGIKVSRIIIFLKSISKELTTAIHPNGTRKITLNRRSVEHTIVRAVNVYMAAYITVFVISLIIITLENKDFLTNFTAVAATLNNIGPGFGEVGPAGNFSGFGTISKLVLTVDMLIGRLEIFPFLIFFRISTWKKQ